MRRRESDLDCKEISTTSSPYYLLVILVIPVILVFIVILVIFVIVIVIIIIIVIIPKSESRIMIYLSLDCHHHRPACCAGFFR